VITADYGRRTEHHRKMRSALGSSKGDSSTTATLVGLSCPNGMIIMVGFV
jgi:hypothetical protein